MYQIYIVSKIYLYICGSNKYKKVTPLDVLTHNADNVLYTIL